MQYTPEPCAFRESHEYNCMKELFAEYDIPQVNEDFIDEFLSGDDPDESFVSIWLSSHIIDVAHKGMNDGRLAPIPVISEYIPDYDIGFTIFGYTPVWYAYIMFDHYTAAEDYFTATQFTDVIGTMSKLYTDASGNWMTLENQQRNRI